MVLSPVAADSTIFGAYEGSAVALALAAQLAVKYDFLLVWLFA